METILRQNARSCINRPAYHEVLLDIQIKHIVEDIQFDVPKIQREVDDAHVESILTGLIEDFKNNPNHVFTISMMEFGMCDDNKIYILNGQHRYACIKRLLKMDDYREYILNSSILVHIHKKKNIHDLERVWERSNTSRPVKMVSNRDKQRCINTLRQLFKKSFGPFMSPEKSKRSYRPNVKLTHMIEIMDKQGLLDMPCLKDAEDLFRQIEILNNFYSEQSPIKWKTEWKISNIDHLLNTINKKTVAKPLYLGIYNNFEWVLRFKNAITSALETCSSQNVNDPVFSKCMIEHYRSYNHYTLHQRVKIPKNVRESVWNNRVPSCENPLCGRCYVCSKTIHYADFECGHIQSVFYGGPTTISNLKAICCGCNRSMGVEHLETYKKKWFS